LLTAEHSTVISIIRTKIRVVIDLWRRDSKTGIYTRIYLPNLYIYLVGYYCTPGRLGRKHCNIILWEEESFHNRFHRDTPLPSYPSTTTTIRITLYNIVLLYILLYYITYYYAFHNKNTIFYIRVYLRMMCVRNG